MQYGGFSRMKHACNAAMPVACSYVGLPYPPLPKSISEFFPEERAGLTQGNIIYILHLMYHQHNINLMVYHWGVQQND